MYFWSENKGAILSHLEEVHAADERSTGHHGVLIHHCLLQVPLDLAQQATVRDAAEHADGIGTVQVCLAVHVLHEGAGNDNDLEAREQHSVRGAEHGAERLMAGGNSSKEMNVHYTGWDGMGWDENQQQ